MLWLGGMELSSKKVITKSSLRKEGLEKVNGQVLYTNDLINPQMLHGAMKSSPHGYAKIIDIDISEAEKTVGVRAVILGADVDYNIGLYLGDKSPIARDVVRHFGEVVAVVVADTLEQALIAVGKINVTYEPLQAILSINDALDEDATLIHPDMKSYAHIDPINPEPGTNIANRTRIRKGDIEHAIKNAKAVIENSVEIPCGDHVAMEPRAAIAEIRKTGEVVITSSTQAPFVVKGLMSVFFNIEPGKIVVKAPMVGGGFGGKAGIQLEGLAYLLSLKVGGRPVKLVNTRESDLLASPGHIGLSANVILAVDDDDKFIGMDLKYQFNSGAYADYAVNISRAAAISCTGPYAVENLRCDSLCVYTNLPFATAYRGFGHIELGFAVERAIDEMAKKLNVDPYDLRRKNGIKCGDTTPVQSVLDESTGDILKCFDEVSNMLGGNIGQIDYIDEQTVRTKGIAGLWKAPAMPTNTDAGAIITFNSDGSCNIHTGVVEIGQGTKTSLAQIAAETLSITFEKVHVEMDVNTKISPSDWATAASRSLMMAGNAVYEACLDAIGQIKEVASIVLKADISKLDVKNERVFVKNKKEAGLDLSEVVLGYMYPNGSSIYGQIIGRGRYIAPKLTDIDKDTGAGHPDLEWTLGAEGVEVEVNIRTGKYKIIKAVCCLDVGLVINPDIARAQTVGGMAMGIGYTTTEAFKFNSSGKISNGTLRDFKIMRYKDAPEYEVKFLETPQEDGPFGARGLGEQSIIGMPGAISNALSRAVGEGLNVIPITAEKVWKKLMEVSHDSI